MEQLHQAFVQQFTQNILRAAAEVGTKTVGEQERRPTQDIAGEETRGSGGLEETTVHTSGIKRGVTPQNEVPPLQSL
ncbi:MAG: hypothetical protein IJ700_03130 [Bacteroidaceae bacterium]|nr:hypothetical protein [Bacteroidaceae bacterium]